MIQRRNPLSKQLEEQGVAVIRALAMDGPLAANSGHQGTAMALAPLAHVLFTRIMKYDASAPQWDDRDRFVLSAGHASILHYSMLHLTGYGLTIGDLKDFRQLHSKTPGHPEAGHTAGVEVTTGPLGQGIANAVGLAAAERYLNAKFGDELVDHYTYVIAGDGDLSEGVSHEACSLAGHLGLGKLIAIYDDNKITIEGGTDVALSDNAVKRFESYGWDVNDIGDSANDLDAIEAAINQAKNITDKPTLIIMRSHIGYPSPNFTGSNKAHGNPFDEAETAATKKVLGLPENEKFWVPQEVLDMYREHGAKGSVEHKAWMQRLEASAQKPAYDAFDSVDPAWAKDVSFEPGTQLATRKASQAVLSALSEATDAVIGGSADLTGSTGTRIDATDQSATSPTGKQMQFGVREHAMGSFLVGAASHGKIIPVSGTFLVFADYMRPPIRLAAMSGTRCIFVFTHDSVGVGEDGPTHQPVEHAMTLRAIPGLQVLRPADANETLGAWQAALDFDGPTALLLSRQNLPVLETTAASSVAKGAYEVTNVSNPDVVLVSTGSEVSLCLEAAAQLASDHNVQARVVSMPSWDLFEKQSADYKQQLLPKNVATLSVEAGVTLGWHRYCDEAIGIDRFGLSAPGALVMAELGINADNVVAQALNIHRLGD